jgi:hypothetical protein
MTPPQALELLLKFFKAETPFEEAHLLAGHASSQIPGLFLNAFSQLSSADQNLVLRVLLHELLQGDALNTYLPQASVILSQTVNRYPSVFVGELLDRVESHLLREDHIATWLADIDSDDEGKDYRSSWRFALRLWNVLASARSTKATSLYERFRNDAKDEHFSRSIEIAKRVHDKGQRWLSN